VHKIAKMIMRRFILLILWGILMSDFAGFAQAPTSTTQAVTQIKTTTATGNDTITNLGSLNPTHYGVCWSTSTDPTIDDDKTEQGTAPLTGTFTSNLTGLSPNTIYYLKAYATNSVGILYGENTSFCTPTEVIEQLLQVFFSKSIQISTYKFLTQVKPCESY
jgi:hypothetical protein